MSSGVDGVSISFDQAGINWKDVNEDATTHLVTLKGTFESQGKTFEVTVTYNKANLQAKLPPDQFAALNQKIASALNDIDTSTLSKLAGHTIRTNYEDLAKKKIQVLTGDQELADWKTSNLGEAVGKIQTVFNKIFGMAPLPVEDDEEDEDSIHASKDDIDIEVDMEESSPAPKKTLKEILPEALYQEQSPRLAQIGKLLDTYGVSKEEQAQFLQKLADNVVKDEDTGQYKVKTAIGERLEIGNLLERIEKGLLVKGSFIDDLFIDNYMHRLVESESNHNTAVVDTSKFRLTNDGHHVVEGALDLKMGQADQEVTKVLIPVNIVDGHWILYCFDATDKAHPVLKRCDSLPEFTATHNPQNHLEILETEILTHLHDAFDLPPEVSIEVKKEPVTAQRNNNCGAHVCINGQWFMEKGQFPEEGDMNSFQFAAGRRDMWRALLP